jgi:hypothetical protein
MVFYLRIIPCVTRDNALDRLSAGSRPALDRLSIDSRPALDGSRQTARLDATIAQFLAHSGNKSGHIKKGIFNVFAQSASHSV